MMKNLFRGLVLAVAAGLAATAVADRYDGYYDSYHGGSENPFSLAEVDTVDAAVAAISERLEDQGFEVVGVVNHEAAAASVGLELPPTQVILFSAPWRDARLVRQRQSVGIDLPQKILVFENDAGDLELKFNTAGYLLDRHNLSAGVQLRIIERTLDQFGDVADSVVTVDSEQSVEDTVAKLRAVLTDEGFRIPFVIDFDAEAGRSSRRGARTVVIVFGNPNVGTQLMQESRKVALDLPQKFLVARDRRGRVTISWNDPAFIAQRGGVRGLETLIGNVSNALRRFATMGATP